MVYVTWKIERTPYVLATNTWSTSSTTLTQYYDPVVRTNLGTARDTFDFKVTNFDDDFSNYFQPNDKITISRVINSSTLASSDVLMLGTVTDVPENVTGAQNQIRVEGYNFSEALLSGIIFFDPRGLTIDVAIQRAINAIKVYNSNFEIQWHSSNPSTTSTGAAFPTVDEKWFNKSVKQFIEKYSTNDATGDDSYYWYVDKDNKLVWRRRSTTVSYSFTTTDDHTIRKISKDIKDVKNWVIIKGGVDPDGSPIQTRVQDGESMGKHGLKPYILTNIAKNAETLVKADKDRALVTSMVDATYPFTPTWTSSSYANYADYVVGLRNYVTTQCELEGNAFLTARKYGKLKVELEFLPGKGWALGDLISCTIPSLSASAKSLRVDDVQYSTDGDVYSLVEDIGSI